MGTARPASSASAVLPHWRHVVAAGSDGNGLDGVAIVAATVAEQPCAMVADFVVQVADSPGTVFVFIDPGAPTHGSICRAPLLGLTVLSLRSLISIAGADQQNSAFDDVVWLRGPHGGPLLEGGHCVMELAVAKRLTASARTVLVGSVLEPPPGSRELPTVGIPDQPLGYPVVN